MKNLTHQDIRFLVESGLLIPQRSDTSESTIFPGKPERVKGKHRSGFASHPAGYPVLNTCSSSDLEHIFPIFIIQNNIKKYLMPECFYNMHKIDILNIPPHLEKQLKHWSSIAKNYISQDIDPHTVSDIEIELLALFRQIYAEYIITYYPNLNMVSKDFFILYDNDSAYRRSLLEIMPLTFYTLPSRKAIAEYIFDNIIENDHNLFTFEQDIVSKFSKNVNELAQLGGIDIDVIHFFYDIVFHQYEKKYKNDSPVLLHLMKYLYNNIRKNMGGTSHVLSRLDIYDISVIKKDLLYFYNNAQNYEIVENIAKILDSHNILPKDPPLLINQEIKTISKNTITINLNNIRKKLRNSLLGAETLIAIISTSFKKDESNYSDIIYEMNVEEEIVKFHIEATDKNILAELSNHFLAYVEAAMSPLFLTGDTIKILTCHNSNVIRGKYEKDESVMDSYNQVKNKFLLNAQLHNDLPQPKVKVKLNKI